MKQKLIKWKGKGNKSIITQVYGVIVGLFPDHHDKVNTAIKLVTQIFWFPSAYKSYVYTIL